MSERIATEPESNAPDGETASAAERNRSESLAKLERLRSENQQLGSGHERSRRGKFRRTAGLLALLGGVSLVGGVVFPELRQVLLALGITGLFAAVLTSVVTPERFGPSDVGTSTYDVFAHNVSSLARQLGLQPVRVYVPIAGSNSARLFIPQHDPFSVPTESELESPLVTAAAERARGLSLVPVGAVLFREFARSLSEPLGSDPDELAPQLTEAAETIFGLASRIEADTTPAEDGLDFEVTDPIWEATDRVDHPLQSFLAVGCAIGLDTPVEVETYLVDESDHDVLISVRTDAGSRDDT